ncbi:MAG: hypothetical protein APF76_06485 [Desulfitibacter sp. BRH_c19]|nr:MAG: hypothetical protein APF76_06485 [Desulfitibacter sp. BRH_c19]
MTDYKDLAQKVNEQVENYSEELVDFLRNFIAAESVTGNEAQAARLLAEEMRRIGFDEVSVDQIGNVVGRVGSGKTVILYDAHMDTVGPGDPAVWGFDPIKGKHEDGYIYGRGACDDKGPLAAMVYAGRAIKDLGLDKEDFTLYVVGITGEEECEGLAVAHLIETEGIKPDYVVIGEASELRICRGHRGRALYQITVPGRAGHASAPHLSDNSLYKAARIVSKIEDLNEQLMEDSFLGKGTIAATKVEVKSNSINTIPGETVVFIDRRLTAGETNDLALQQLEEIANPYEGKVELMYFDSPSYTGYVKEAEEFFPAWVLEEEHSLIQSGAQAFEALFNEKAVIDKWGFSTDGTYTMGRAGIPTLGFGPGEGVLCHCEGERISVSDLKKASAFYTLLPKMITKN